MPTPRRAGSFSPLAGRRTHVGRRAARPAASPAAGRSSAARARTSHRPDDCARPCGRTIVSSTGASGGCSKRNVCGPGSSRMARPASTSSWYAFPSTRMRAPSTSFPSRVLRAEHHAGDARLDVGEPLARSLSATSTGHLRLGRRTREKLTRASRERRAVSLLLPALGRSDAALGAPGRGGGAAATSDGQATEPSRIVSRRFSPGVRHRVSTRACRSWCRRSRC